MNSAYGAFVQLVGLGRSVWDHLVAHPRRAVALAIVLSCALRLPFLDAPFGDDEGGYLYVAQHWSDGGHWLYGAQWVDRPPVLVLIFRLAALLGGTTIATRLVAMAVAAVLVAAAGYAGRRIAGAEGAVASAFCAAALASSPLVLGNELNSDGIGAMFVLVSFALLLGAMHHSGRRRAPLLAALAGMAGVMAVLSKQSALLGVFVAGLVLVGSLRRHWPLALGYAAGALVPLAATVVWAVRGPGLGMLVNALFSFRVGAAGAMASGGDASAQLRALGFALLVLPAGFAFPLALLAVDMVTRRGQVRLRLLVAAVVVCVGAILVASLNWYRYYWLAVVPVAAIGVAMAFAPAERRGIRRLHPQLVVAATVLCGVVGVAVQLAQQPGRPAVSLVVARAAYRTDTVVVVWGRPNLIEETGLRTPYPYSWSLPVRVEDPHLRLFARVLAGPSAPTWIIEVGRFGEWGLGGPRIQRLVQERYHVAARICGKSIYLRNGLVRPVAAAEAAARAEGGSCSYTN